MYEALIGAGLDITEEGVLTLFAMIDEDGNGNIDRDEWRDTVEFYLELEKEEAEMHEQSFHEGVEGQETCTVGQKGLECKARLC